MSDLFKGIQDVFISRLKNMFFINFLMSWIFINYQISLKLLFDDMKIDEKINYIHNIEFSSLNFIFLPLLVTMGYIFLLPYINLLINIWFEKFINKDIEKHKHEKLLNNYELMKERQRAKLESSTFVEKQLELELKEKANNLEADAEKIKEIKIELKKYKNDLEKANINNNNLTEENKKLSNLFNAIKYENENLSNDMSKLTQEKTEIISNYQKTVTEKEEIKNKIERENINLTNRSELLERHIKEITNELENIKLTNSVLEQSNNQNKAEISKLRNEIGKKEKERLKLLFHKNNAGTGTFS